MLAGRIARHPPSPRAQARRRESTKGKMHATKESAQLTVREGLREGIRGVSLAADLLQVDMALRNDLL